MAIDDIINLTTKTMNEWKNAYGWAPDSAAKKLDRAMLNWIIELTSCLRIWFEKGESMTEGELILARTNMGSLIESWLKFFYPQSHSSHRSETMQKWDRGTGPLSPQSQ